MYAKILAHIRFEINIGFTISGYFSSCYTSLLKIAERLAKYKRYFGTSSFAWHDRNFTTEAARRTSLSFILSPEFAS